MRTKNTPATNSTRAAARPEPAAEPDGRRRRGNTSRARIVDALSKLVGEGDFTPRAARVAEVAGVSLRTVFRHFDEMDSLYREIAESIAARVLPALFRPYRFETWRERLLEMVERRIELYEAILPFKVSGDLRRFQSAFLANDYEKHLQLEKMSLESLLPAEMVEDVSLSHALRSATGFQNWRILRKDQELGVEDARGVVVRTIEALLASHAPGSGPTGKRKQ